MHNKAVNYTVHEFPSQRECPTTRMGHAGRCFRTPYLYFVRHQLSTNTTRTSATPNTCESQALSMLLYSKGNYRPEAQMLPESVASMCLAHLSAAGPFRTESQSCTRAYAPIQVSLSLAARYSRVLRTLSARRPSRSCPRPVHQTFRVCTTTNEVAASRLRVME